MNKIIKLSIFSLFGMVVFPTIVSADVKKGQKIFLKKLQSSCTSAGITNSAKFAMKHTQDEWETIKQAGKFSAEVIKICPKVIDKLEHKYEKDLYDFSYEYASDSGNVPSY